MNIQSLMKQAQKLQKQMQEAKEEIDTKTFVGQSSLVKIEMLGNKTVQQVKIDTENLDLDDIEILEDMILIATNDVLNKIEKETNEKMGSHAQNMPGIF